MIKPTILYLIRAEGDLERIVSLAIPGKKYADQHLIYFGDISMIFNDGIKNEFQKYLLESNNIDVKNAISFSIFGRVYNLMFKKQFRSDKKIVLFIIRILLMVIRKIIYLRQKRLAESIIKKINPDIFITDCSSEWENYFPETLRKVTKANGKKIFLVNHGAAGGIQRIFLNINDSFDRGWFPYDGCTVGICSKYDVGNASANRLVVGDPAYSFPYIRKNNIDVCDVNFLNNRKYKIGFLIGAPKSDMVNSWSVMEEIILDYTGDDNVAMICKMHPRMDKESIMFTVGNIKNFKMFGAELDTTRLVRWANIVVCSDHCSTIFQPMMMEKKVVALCAHKAKTIAHLDSPIHKSDPSINSISRSSEFELEGLTDYTDNKSFINEYCWGDHGPIDLGEKIIRDLTNELNETLSNSN